MNIASKTAELIHDIASCVGAVDNRAGFCANIRPYIQGAIDASREADAARIKALEEERDRSKTTASATAEEK